MRSSSANAEMKATVGAQSAGISTLCAIPCHSTPFSPDWTSAAPISPPIRACDDDEGNPSHHVKRFQTIAPATAASTVFGVARPVSMIPFPTVFATAVVTKAPARLAIAAIRTASLGERARVEIEVATAFAVSWKPDRKSTRLNSSHMSTSYAVICLTKKKKRVYLSLKIRKIQKGEKTRTTIKST